MGSSNKKTVEDCEGGILPKELKVAHSYSKN
jgi:hypothetical protein